MTAEYLILFAKAYALGFVIAMPVGPISALILRRTITGGIPVGVATGLGAAVADAIYGGCAAFGLSAVTAFLEGEARLLGLVGGAILLWLGIRGFVSAGRRGDAAGAPLVAAGDGREINGLAPAFASSVALTLTNPLTILSYAAAFAGIGLAAAGGVGAATATTLGLALGSATWQLVIVAAAGGARRWLKGRVLATVDRLSGVVLVGFGMVALVRAAYG
jgi:threonine/homoserine/homoserine lactone efflux protein